MSASRTADSAPRALIVNAPFGLIEFPHLGTSLVVASAREAGFACDAWYATLDFAHEIGFLEYLTIERSACPMLLPERVFARSLFPALPSIDAFYADLVEPFGEELWPTVRGNARSVARSSMRRVEEAAFEFVARLETRRELGGYDVIAFSSSYGQQLASLAMAARVKALWPDVVIAFGGANCEGVMGWQLVRSFPFVDYAFSGDGDVSFPKFLAALRGGAILDHPGVFHRDGPAFDARAAPPARQQLDALPDPDFSAYFAALERLPEARGYCMGIPIEGSRGCWWGEKHHCTFCGLNGMTMRYRAKSPERFCAELERLVASSGQTHVMASDNILDRGYLKTVVPALAERRAHEVLFFETKSNLTRDELVALADAGITHLQPGIESLSTSVLQLMDKGTTAIQNVQLLKWSEELGISLNWNLLCGFPGEKSEEYDQMAELIAKIPHLQPPLAMSRISIDRFSPYFDHPERYGMRTAPAPAYRYVYDLPAAEVANLAYWYAYECENGSSRSSLAPPVYARRAARARKIWERLYGNVRCSWESDADGRVRIRDERPAAAATECVLDAVESRVFLACDAARSRASLARELGDVAPDALDAALARLESKRFLHREGDHHLALATRAEARPKAPALGARGACFAL